MANEMIDVFGDDEPVAEPAPPVEVGADTPPPAPTPPRRPRKRPQAEETVTVLVRHNGHRRGDVVTLPAGEADRMIRAGLAARTVDDT